MFCFQSKKHSYSCCKDHEKAEDCMATSKTKDLSKVSPGPFALLFVNQLEKERLITCVFHKTDIAMLI